MRTPLEMRIELRELARKLYPGEPQICVKQAASEMSVSLRQFQNLMRDCFVFSNAGMIYASEFRRIQLRYQSPAYLRLDDAARRWPCTKRHMANLLKWNNISVIHRNARTVLIPESEFAKLPQLNAERLARMATARKQRRAAAVQAATATAAQTP